jgi:hypothetical protein
MSISKTVRISELYPSNVQDLTKSFREADLISDPYGLSRDGSTKRQIQNLVAEVEAGLKIKDPARRNGPYSSNLDGRVDAVNSATTVITDDPSKQVPKDIRFIQLAHFHNPEVDGHQYSYGLMMHFTSDNLSDATEEFAVLVPYEKDENIPALILSNGEKIDKSLELMVKVLAYARQKKVSKIMEH